MVKQKALVGVNLGGWLIPERWLTPSLFAGTGAEDMYGLTKTKIGQERLEKHFQTFITEADFQWLKDHDIDIVRLPIGYWTFGGDESYADTSVYTDWVMQMCEKYVVKCIIDVHAVKGSQNGETHSGRQGTHHWQHERAYQDETIDTLMKIANRYRDHPQFWGLELVNEPRLGWSYFTLLRFYRRANIRLKTVLPANVKVIFHDAFHPFLFAGALSGKKAP